MRNMGKERFHFIHIRAVGSKMNMVQLIWHALRAGEIVFPN